jgi:tRNA(adenine34) deaminase
MSNNLTDFPMMRIALELADKAAHLGEVPVGCVITDKNGNILASSHNLSESNDDVTAHAEILAIRAAQKNLQKEHPSHNRLEDCTLYVTLEPCPMCAQAISFARIKRVYYGAADEKSGGVENGARVLDSSSCHFKPEVYSGIMQDECSAILKNFFNELRADK